MKVNAILLKPLDGDQPGAARQFDKVDFDRLRGMSAVREAGPDDATADVVDDVDTQLLERLRHPTDGPRLLADMKASFERSSAELMRLTDELAAARVAADEAGAARDSAVNERDAAIGERDEARAAVTAAEAARDALQLRLDTPPGGDPAAAAKTAKNR